MTEMKYIFPKQLQSVAALAFIAVLIALLLILTVMVHMRNRKTETYAGRTDGRTTAFWTKYVQTLLLSIMSN